MNPNIILSGRSPNIVNALAQGTQAAGMANDVRRQNHLADLYRTQGPDIAAGNQNALNALAQLDPMVVRQMKMQDAEAARADERLQMQQRGQSHNMNVDNQRLDMAREQGRLAAEKWAHDQEMVRKAQEANQAIMQLGPLYEQGKQSGDMSAFEAQVQVINQDPDMAETPLSVDNFELFAAANEGVGQALAERLEPKDEYDRYAREQRARGYEPLDRIAYAQAKKGNGFSVTTPDGISVQYGGGAKVNKTTEGEKSSAGYLSRMRAAEEILTELSVDEPAVRSVTSLLVAGSNFEGLVLDDRQERILQAQRDWVRAKLRKESGAVIGDEEMAEEIRTYFPLPGEGPKVVEQKRRARLEAEKQFEIMSGGAAAQIENSGSEAEEARETSLAAPKVGAVDGGYRFKGGDPSKRENWEIVE